jgi:hypothetical protein
VLLISIWLPGSVRLGRPLNAWRAGLD